MKAYRIELLVIDFDGIGGGEIQAVLEAERFPNDCINLSVKRVDSQDIGAWTDDHPLNRAGTSSAEYERLFGSDRLAEEKAREAEKKLGQAQVKFAAGKPRDAETLVNEAMFLLEGR